MRFNILLGGLIILAVFTTGYSNNSMTDEYRMLTNNDPIHAVDGVYTGILGDWFYMLLIIIPYMGLYLYQRSTHIASIWLLTMLVAYGYLLEDVPHFMFFLVIVFWVMSLLVRALSPKYTN